MQSFRLITSIILVLSLGLPIFVIMSKAPLFAHSIGFQTNDKPPDINHQRLKSGRSGIEGHRPSAMPTVDQLAHHTAQKHNQHPCCPQDKYCQLERSCDYRIAEHEE